MGTPKYRLVKSVWYTIQTDFGLFARCPAFKCPIVEDVYALIDCVHAVLSHLSRDCAYFFRIETTDSFIHFAWTHLCAFAM